jgi:CsoR family transcriptional regulator, copper-sensing transcriptional repressor
MTTAMTAAFRPEALDGRRRAPVARRDREIASRLRRATGQLAGVTRMHDDGRYCIDVLDQLSAVSAAIDTVALLVLEDHIHTCVLAAIEDGDAEAKVDELAAAVCRYVRTR